MPVFPSNALSTPIWPSSAFASSSGYSAGSLLSFIILPLVLGTIVIIWVVIIPILIFAIIIRVITRVSFTAIIFAAWSSVFYAHVLICWGFTWIQRAKMGLSLNRFGSIHGSVRRNTIFFWPYFISWLCFLFPSATRKWVWEGLGVLEEGAVSSKWMYGYFWDKQRAAFQWLCYFFDILQCVLTVMMFPCGRLF